jgi:hypothetical protein
MLALVADGEVFTGDTLFKRSVGGVRGPTTRPTRTSSGR